MSRNYVIEFMPKAAEMLVAVTDKRELLTRIEALGKEVVVLVIGMGRRREGNRGDVYAQIEQLTEEKRQRGE